MLTVRAGMEVCRQVGQLCRPVASVSDEYGVAWATACAAVLLHDRPLVDGPSRVRAVRALGVDEHSFLAATREHHTIYATALVDLDRRRVIDLFEGKSSARLRNWCAKRPKRWLSGVRVVALDLTDTYRSGLSPHLSHARHVADPFHDRREAVPNCRCHSDPDYRHGPYRSWTRKVAGKTVTRNLNDDQLQRYRDWFDNDRRLKVLVTELEELAINVLARAEGWTPKS